MLNQIKVINLLRYFTNGAELEIHYSSAFSSATLRFRADKLNKRCWVINIKSEIDTKTMEEILTKYLLCDEINVTEFVGYIKKVLGDEA